MNSKSINYISFILTFILILPLINSFAGGSGTEGSPYQISTCAHLVDINSHPTKYFKLINDIECGVSPYNIDPGFPMITAEFTGNFNGNNFNISNLYINKPTSTTSIGLFQKTLKPAAIYNISLLRVDITGKDSVGALLGSGVDQTASNPKTVFNAYAQGNVTGAKSVGGLIGHISYITVENSNFLGEVIGSSSSIGGLVGESYGSKITNSAAVTTSVQGSNRVGGLVGYLYSGSVENSYSQSTELIASSRVGGITGYSQYGLIKNSYVNVTKITSSSTASGGVLGYSYGASIENSFSVVDEITTSASSKGGLVGYETYSSTFTNNYWNNVALNPSTAVGGGSGTATAISNNQAYFYTSTNAPLNVWSSAIWNFSGSSFPTINGQTFKVGTPPPPPPPLLPGEIRTCQDITNSSQPYYLSQDIVTTNTCIRILASNVELDCKGFSITGDQSVTKYGIELPGETYDNNNISNCIINDFTYALRVNRADNNKFENLTTSSTQGILYLNRLSSDNIFKDISFQKPIRIYTDNGLYSLSQSNTFENVKDSNNKYITYISNNPNVNIDGWTNISSLILYNTQNAIVKNIQLGDTTNLGSGIFISSSNNVELDNITLTNFTESIYLFESDFSKLNNLNIYSSYEGIRLHTSKNNVINNSKLNYNSRGIYLDYKSDLNYFLNSDFSNNSNKNLEIRTGGSYNPKNNTFINNSLGVTSKIMYPAAGGINFFNGTLNGFNIGNLWSDLTCSANEMRGTTKICTNPSQFQVGASSGVYDYAPQVPPSVDTAITTCQDLTSQGGTYYLTQDITSAGNCININADDITLDCKGFTISGPSSNNGVSITNTRNSIIKDCKFKDFRYGVSSYGYSNGYNLIENVTFINSAFENSLQPENTFRNILFDISPKIYHTHYKTYFDNVSDGNGKYVMSFYSQNNLVIDGWTNISSIHLNWVQYSVIKNLDLTLNNIYAYGLSTKSANHNVFENIKIRGSRQPVKISQTRNLSFNLMDLQSPSIGLGEGLEEYANNVNEKIRVTNSTFSNFAVALELEDGLTLVDNVTFINNNNALSFDTDNLIIKNSKFLTGTNKLNFRSNANNVTIYNNQFRDLSNLFYFQSTNNGYISFNYTNPQGHNIGNFWQDFTCSNIEKRGENNEYNICINPSNYTINAPNNVFDYAPQAYPYTIKYTEPTPKNNLNKFNLTFLNLSILIEGTTIDSCYYIIDSIKYDGNLVGNNCNYDYLIPQSNANKNTVQFQGYYNISNEITPLEQREINSYSKTNPHDTNTSNVPSYGFLSLLMSLILIFTIGGIRK